MLRAIYGMLVAEPLFYSKFCGYLENIGFKFNSFNPYVANKIKFGKQQTVIFHVDIFIFIHVNPKVNDNFKEWVNCNSG